ncbi:MAG: biotin synthase BioB [Alphaproteobacteria bacterium]
MGHGGRANAGDVPRRRGPRRSRQPCAEAPLGLRPGVDRQPRDRRERASLLSIKTGGGPEDCAYCPQSAHHGEVDLTKQGLMAVDEVLAAAAHARAAGASRFCMGAAWREVRDGRAFERVLEMVRGVRALGMEACVTLGMLDRRRAERLAAAGLTAYNHNIDTSPDFFAHIITTRTFDDRLRTLRHVRDAGIRICSGGIIGMGESADDRADMLQVLASLDPHPESVPINALVAVPGTPLADRPPVGGLQFARCVAVARILMPHARVRLWAGRRGLSAEAQTLCLLAGHHSIFYGEQLLTTPNPERDADQRLLSELGAADARAGTADAAAG